MKKLFFVVLCIAAITFASCSKGCTNSNENTFDTLIVDSVDTVLIDTVA